MSAKNTVYQITDKQRSCIIIDRQHGSDGREAERILSQKLGIPFYDGEFLLLATERFGLNPGRLREKNETRSKSLLHDIAMFAGGLQDCGQMFEPYQMFEAMNEAIHRLAMEGPAIFMGRCADMVLKEVYASLDTFIYASSMEEQVSHVRAADHVPTEDTETHIRKKDQQRREHYKMFVEKEWGKIENYDICLNMSSFGYEGYADIITAMAGRTGSGRKKE